MAKRYPRTKTVFRVIFKILGALIGIALKFALAGLFLVSKLFEIGLIHINRAAEMILTGKRNIKKP